jgi:signal transduction histidine kinase
VNSLADEHTRIFKGRESVSNAIEAFFANSRTKVDICTTQVDPKLIGWSKALNDAYLAVKAKGVRLRMVISIDSRNAKQCKELAKAVELRHVEGIRGTFGVSDSEYMASAEESELLGELIYSNSRAFVRQHQAIFEMMWENGIPAEQKIEEIEVGIASPETKIIRDVSKAAELAKSLIERTKNEVLIVLASHEVISRNARSFDFLLKKSKERGFKIRVLAPVDFREAARRLPGITWRPIVGITAGIAIYDGSGALLTQYSKAGSEGTGHVVSNIFTTNMQFVAAMISMFEAMWNESDLRQAEERNRRMAEVTKDILAHDMRNYNQIELFGVDSLKERIKDPESKKSLDSISGAIEGSTKLIDRAMELGRILSQDKVRLKPMRLDESFKRALSMIGRAHPDRTLELSSTVASADVLADELLDEVFVNILSNAVKYTDGRKVRLETTLEEADIELDTGTRTKCWKLTIADHGKGMAKDTKNENFPRYMPSDKGSGLGLSIVRALVVNRYSGAVRLRDRVESDFAKGTAVEISLPKAKPRRALQPPAKTSASARGRLGRRS